LFPIIVGLNYRTAPLEVLERMSLHHSQIPSSLQELRGNGSLEGVVIVSTCNRLEIYAVASQVKDGINAIQDFLAKHNHIEKKELCPYLYDYSFNLAVKHLFRVASGLDSMVLGETEILGQVARAYETACTAGVSHKIINVWFQKALAVGKKARSQTGIDQFSISISNIAVLLAKQLIESFQEKKILLLGAGEMNELIMKHLVSHGASIVMIANRSLDKAKKLAAEYRFEAVPFNELKLCLQEADIVFSATSSKRYLITEDEIVEIMKVRQQRPLLLIDIALPRDIDPKVKNIECVSHYDMGDLRNVADNNQNARKMAAQEIERITEEEMVHFNKWHNSLFIFPTIQALQEHAEGIKNSQINQALAKLPGITQQQEKVIRSLANSIVNQLFHHPFLKLKEAANISQGSIYAETLQELFHLVVDNGMRNQQGNQNSCDLKEASNK